MGLFDKLKKRKTMNNEVTKYYTSDILGKFTLDKWKIFDIVKCI